VTWTKLSDDFSDDCWELSDAAWRLHAEGLVWSNRKLTDLKLYKGDMVRWAKRQAAAEELVANGWWQDWGDHYEILHHGAYQRSRDAVIKQQEANRKNGKRGGRRIAPSREQAADLKPPQPDSLSDSLTQRDGTGRAWTGKGVDLCWVCKKLPAVWADAQSEDDNPANCRECNDHAAEYRRAI